MHLIPKIGTNFTGYPKNIVDNNGDTIILAGLAIDPTTGVGYATDDYDFNEEYSALYTIDLKTGIATFKTDIQGLLDAEGLAFADDGKLYVEDEGYETGESRFFALNPDDGTFVASARYPVGFDEDADIEAISCNGGESVVAESFKPSVFNAWDQDESILNQIIKTKIVGDDITLTFASIDELGSTFESTSAKTLKYHCSLMVQI